MNPDVTPDGTIPPEPLQEPAGALAPTGGATPILAELACTSSCPSGAFAEIHTHLHQTLCGLERQAFALKSGSIPSELAAIAAPFVARSIIEATCTALIGRFDPFRLLIMREKQLLEDYDYSVRNPIAINWNTDFISDQKSAGTIDSQTRAENLPRSLFGKYYERVLWLEAMEKFGDHAKTPRSDWLIELNKTAPEAFIPTMRTSVQQLYSRCSKAIHQEFVIKNADYGDTLFLNVQLGQSLEYAAKLSVIFNSSPHVLYPNAIDQSIELFQELNERWSA
jgi:hypothetical protein